MPWKGNGTKAESSRSHAMSEQHVPAAVDPVGHRPGCPHYGEVPEADPGSFYADLFCNCHDNAEPEVMANGTDIAWPSGWTQQMAAEWRMEYGLTRPSGPDAGP